MVVYIARKTVAFRNLTVEISMSLPLVRVVKKGFTHESDTPHTSFVRIEYP